MSAAPGNVFTFQKEALRTEPTNEWPDLIPLSLSVPDSIPRASMIGWLGDMAQAVSDATETPLEMPGLLSLVVAASCNAGKVIVMPEPGYIEPLNIYACPTMSSGERKTRVLNHLQRPLVDWEREEGLRLAPERRKVIGERHTLELQIERLRKHAAGKPNPRFFFEEIYKLEESLPAAPVLPRLFVDDCTPEALALRLQENGQRMALFSDEGGIFETLAGRYSSGVPNLDLFLKAHSGSPVRVDRANKDRPPILLDNPLLTVGISPQPDVLESLRDKPGFRGRGLLARFLYALPASRVGYRALKPKEVPDDVARRYQEGLYALIRHTPETPLVLRFCAAAYSEWKDFQMALEPQFRLGGALDGLKDWGNKLAGAAARVAANLHMVEQAHRPTIETEIPHTTVTGSVELTTSLISHARAAFALMAADPNMEAAGKIVAWIIRSNQTSFTQRECFRLHQWLFKSVDALQPILSLLEERGYVRKLPRESSSSGGRPPDVFEVNPVVLKPAMEAL